MFYIPPKIIFITPEETLYFIYPVAEKGSSTPSAKPVIKIKAWLCKENTRE